MGHDFTISVEPTRFGYLSTISAVRYQSEEKNVLYIHNSWTRYYWAPTQSWAINRSVRKMRRCQKVEARAAAKRVVLEVPAVDKMTLASPDMTNVNQYGVSRELWEEYAKIEKMLGRRLIPFEDWRNEIGQGEISF